MKCPNCGAELDTDSPESLCPRCLIENAAWSQTVAVPEDAAAVPPMPPPELPATQQILPDGSDFGDYRILKLLGRGGMGAVYEAEQKDNGRRVALKVLSRQLDSETARARFLREGRLAASINHPNSVYVFGTGEVDGTPVISMEIVSGGNLQEKVIRDGPMPVTRAVDVILQLVSGLEAAQAIGILHRDVKPSNCFMDRDGTAKIGDFGLSISSEARGDSDITLAGAPLGTPAFASPEQLRGEELNARSDLYSVGSTLFFLLTGEIPFRETNVIKLISRVLEEAPPDPRSLRPEIPPGLSRIILRCLAKTPGDRFKSYADLRAALQPHGSTAPTPATLALRCGAYMLDTLVMAPVGIGIQALLWGGVGEIFNQGNIASDKYLIAAVGLNLMVALYFGVLEGTRGASLGKKILRLRLVNTKGNLAGFSRAFLRACLLIILLALPYWIMLPFHPELISGSQGGWVSMLLSFGGVVTLGLMFCRARRRNGYAGLHGLATGTRVVRTPVAVRRPRLLVAERSADEVPAGSERIGPYHVIETLGATQAGEWLLGYDTKLLRRVWVHSVPIGTPPVFAGQRDQHRQSRLRWITDRRSDDQSWDAYEAPAGLPLSSLVNGAQSWEAVRFWLLDLAEEFTLASAEGSVPATLAFDRVWITTDGHAKLLDLPAPGAAPDTAVFETPEAFLQGIGEATVRASKPPIPLHARPFLHSTGPNTLESLLGLLRLTIRRPAGVSRLRRLLITAGVSAFPMVGLFFVGAFMVISQSVRKNNPDLLDLSTITTMIQYSRDQGGTAGFGNLTTLDTVLKHSERDGHRENLRRFVAYRYRDLIENPETWHQWQSNLIVDPHRQRLAREALADHPTLTAEEITAAKEAAAPFLKKNTSVLPPFAPVLVFFGVWIMYAAVPSLLMALIARRGLILTMCGAVVVDADGKRASRLRALWRCLIAWLPLLAGAALAASLSSLPEAIAILVLMLGFVSLSLLRRDRSLQDRIAGTWLVPK